MREERKVTKGKEEEEGRKGNDEGNKKEDGRDRM